MQAYTNPAHASDPYKLPDLEVQKRDGLSAPEVRYLTARRHAAQDRTEGRIAAALRYEKIADAELHDCADPDEIEALADDLASLPYDDTQWENAVKAEAAKHRGFYVACCLPGCLPDSDWAGPYPTADAAIEAAREMYVSDDGDED